MVPFNPSMLTVARESRELTQAELARHSGVPQAVLSKIEAGIKEPSEEQVRGIASALHYPESFFSDQDRIYGFNASVFFHRKRSDLPAKVLKRIHAALNLARMRMDKLMLAGSMKPAVDLPRFSVEDHGGPEEIARRVRAVLQLPDGPVADLTASLEEAGVMIVQCKFNTRRIDAVSEWVPGHPPIVLMNVDDHVPGDRYRWTLAHELGHLLMHTRPSDEMEEEANRFASEFLLPARELRPKLRVVRLQTLALLKTIWKVSMGALLERAKQLGTITVRQYTNMRINFSKHGYGTQEPADLAIAIEKPTLLQSLVKLHTNQLGYTLGELSTLLRMSTEECAQHFMPQVGLRLLGTSLKRA